MAAKNKFPSSQNSESRAYPPEKRRRSSNTATNFWRTPNRCLQTCVALDLLNF